jgi:hypothetical protein
VGTKALTILNWVAEEHEKGRVVISSNKDGVDNFRLAVESLKDPKHTASDAAAEEGFEYIKLGVNDSAFMEKMRRVLSMSSDVAVFEAALSVLAWAAYEVSREQGRTIYSCTKTTKDDAGGNDPKRLSMDCLTFAAASAIP